MRSLIFMLTLLMALPVAAEQVDFTLKDLDGKPVSLSDFRGKWVIVNYWATWCPPCLEEIPDLVSLYEDNRDSIVVLGVAYEEVNMEYLQEFVETHMMSYPVMQMDPIPVTELGPVLGLPTSYIISPEGERMARVAWLVPVFMSPAACKVCSSGCRRVIRRRHWGLSVRLVIYRMAG